MHGHYLQSVLAWCANCQGGDTSVSTESCGGGEWGGGGQVWIWTQQLKLIFPTAYVSCDTIFTGNSAEPQRAPCSVCIRPKPEEKVKKLFWIHWKRSGSFISSVKKECIKVLSGPVSSQHQETQLVLKSRTAHGQTDSVTALSPTGLVGFWCRVSVCVPEWYHAQSSGVSNPNNAVGSALFVWTCTDCNQGSYG